jgi:predicted acylesterase/phospholipase RssA
VCISKYLDFSKSVFRFDKNILTIPVGENNAYFDEKPLEDALKNVIREETNSENTPLADDDDPSCPVFVVTAYGRIADGPLKLFRSYGFDKDPTPIWQAARATSAAPAFFPPARVTIPSPPGWYVDGGVRANNPSWEAMGEGKTHWKARKCFIVSVGTGLQKPVDFIGKKRTSATATLQSEPVENPEPKVKVQQPHSKQRSKAVFGGLKEGLKKAGTKIGGTIKSAARTVQPVTDKAAQITRFPGGAKVAAHIMKALVSLSTSSESTHLRVWGEANSQEESAQFPYFRFNVLRGMDEIGLEEWRMAEAMADMTRSYLDSPEVNEELRKCAEGLHNPSAFEST